MIATCGVDQDIYGAKGACDKLLCSLKGGTIKYIAGNPKSTNWAPITPSVLIGNQALSFVKVVGSAPAVITDLPTIWTMNATAPTKSASPLIRKS